MSMVDMNGELFEKMTEKGQPPTVVEFWAPWCVYCRRIGPALKKIEEQYDGVVDIGRVNIDDEPQISEKEKIEVVPTFVFYKDGEAVDSMVAPDSKAKLEEFINSNLNR